MGVARGAESSRNGSVAAWVGAIGGLLGGIATIVGVVLSSDPSPPAAPSVDSSQTTTTGAEAIESAESPLSGTLSSTFTEDERQLARRVSRGLMNCGPVNPDDAIPGSISTLRCEPRYIAFPIDVRVSSFPENPDALDSFISDEEKQVETKHRPETVTAGDNFAQANGWVNSKGVRIGRLVCYVKTDGTSRIVWTFENDAFRTSTDNETFVVVADSRDQEALVDWWNKLPV